METRCLGSNLVLDDVPARVIPFSAGLRSTKLYKSDLCLLDPLTCKGTTKVEVLGQCGGKRAEPMQNVLAQRGGEVRKQHW